MEYQHFKQVLKTELPLNRKEKFYTATIFPSLLFHNGLHNFFHFLSQIKYFPSDINELATGDNFLFYTEYNLKQSAGERCVGKQFDIEANDTPDVVIEILKPSRALIVVEGKMFQNLSQAEFHDQMNRQREVIIEPLKKEYALDPERIFHIALVPAALSFSNTQDYQVLCWEGFVNDQGFRVQDNYFFNYLKIALENYGDLVQKCSTWGKASTVERMCKGYEIIKMVESGAKLWVGRKGGERKIQTDIDKNIWQNHNYSINQISSYPPSVNWIAGGRFKEMVIDQR